MVLDIIHFQSMVIYPNDQNVSLNDYLIIQYYYFLHINYTMDIIHFIIKTSHNLFILFNHNNYRKFNFTIQNYVNLSYELIMLLDYSSFNYKINIIFAFKHVYNYYILVFIPLLINILMVFILFLNFLL